MQHGVKQAGETPSENAGTTGAPWTFLTNHSHVLVCLAHDPDMRLRDVANLVGITERAVQRIVADLEEAGILTRTRDGRRNRYDIHPDAHLRHPIEAQVTIGELLSILGRQPLGVDTATGGER